MKNEDRKIPATRVTLIMPGSFDKRKQSVVKISAHRPDGKAKRPDDFSRNTDVRSRKPDDLSRNTDVRSRRPDDLSRSKDVRSRRPDDLSRSKDVRSRRPDDLSRSKDVRSRRPDDLSRNTDVRSRRPDGFSGKTDARSRKFNNFLDEQYSNVAPKNRATGTEYMSGGSPRKRIEKAGSPRERSFKPFIVEIIISALLLAAVCAFRTVLVFANNTELVSFSELAKPMWTYMGISAAVFMLLRLFLRRPYFASMFVAFGAFLAVNLDWLMAFVRQLINDSRSAAIGSLILYAVLIIGFFFFLRLLYKKKIRLHAAVKILAATFTCLVLFNVVTAFMAVGHASSNNEPEPTTAQVAEATPVSAPTPSAVPTTSAVTSLGEFGRPNIYFFILDEFSSFDMLEKYYGYDVKPFNDYLVSAGFNISRESYGTDNQTEHALCDLVNLDYISRHMSKDECYSAITNGKLQKELSELGYTQYRLTGGKYFEGIDTLLTGSGVDDGGEDSNVFGDTGTDDISGGIGGIIGGLLDPNSDTPVETSALNKFGFYPSDYIRDTKEYRDNKRSPYADSLLKKFDYLENPNSFTGAAAPRVTYCYMLATHVPFMFNEYGGIIPFSQNRNWEDTNVYLNQYKFINKRLIATLSTIINNDPDSIIILMSDHGIRYHNDCTKKHKFIITDKDSCRIMNAVYIKGQKYDIEGLSGVNTLRFILSLYEGNEQDFPPIKDPITPDSPDCLKNIIPRSRHS